MAMAEACLGGIGKYLLARPLPMSQCKPPDNSKIDFTIVNRCTLIIVIGRKINYSVLDGWIFSRVHPPRQ